MEPFLDALRESDIVSLAIYTMYFRDVWLTFITKMLSNFFTWLMPKAVHVTYLS